jgi:hypothetical protein
MLDVCFVKDSLHDSSQSESYLLIQILDCSTGPSQTRLARQAKRSLHMLDRFPVSAQNGQTVELSRSCTEWKRKWLPNDPKLKKSTVILWIKLPQIFGNWVQKPEPATVTMAIIELRRAKISVVVLPLKSKCGAWMTMGTRRNQCGVSVPMAYIASKKATCTRA